MFKFIRYIRTLLSRMEAILDLLENPALPGGKEFEEYLFVQDFIEYVTINFKGKSISTEGITGTCEGAGSIINKVFYDYEIALIGSSPKDKIVVKTYIMIDVNGKHEMVMVNPDKLSVRVL